MPKPMIPGGQTHSVANAGGEDLFFKLAMASAGKRLDVCTYAATRYSANLAITLDDINQAKKLLRQMAEDAINELELNWDDRKRLMSASRAAIMTEAGHG